MARGQRIVALLILGALSMMAALPYRRQDSLQETSQSSIVSSSACATGNLTDAIKVASLADAKPCPQFIPSGSCDVPMPDGQIGEHGLCLTDELTSAIQDGSCLVYGVGVADNWEFEKAMALKGCEVHAFDPTIEKPPDDEPGRQLPAEAALNLHFHRWGLAGQTNRHGEHEVRGTLSGAKVTDQPMLTLADMMKELGHTGRRLTVLKVDCEGCEWASLSVVPTGLWSRIGQLSLELHFSDGLMLDSPEQVKNAAKVASALQAQGFTKWRPDIREGWPWHRHLLPELLEAGMPAGFCCRLAGFYRKDPAKVVRKEVSSASRVFPWEHLASWRMGMTLE